MDHLLEVLRKRFGVSDFRPGQRKVIKNILAGQSMLVVFPTGGGKSLCYQLPAVMLEGVTLVISPLIALMNDQIKGLVARGIMARKLDSTLTSESQDSVWTLVKAGRVEVLFVAPERFVSTAFQRRIRGITVPLLVVDEAHCVSEWGHSFRPDYLTVSQYAERMGIPIRLALTATATERVCQDIGMSFGIKVENFFRTSIARPNLRLEVRVVTSKERKTVLLQEILEHDGEPSIVYVARQMTAEAVVSDLKRSGVTRVSSYHAGLSKEYRAEVQSAFLTGTLDLIVATIAFGMGIDKSNIRHIYHYNMPRSYENYVQETGRAGRNGQEARGLLLACEDDLTMLKNSIYTKKPNSVSIDAILYQCLARDEVITLNLYDLTHVHDLKMDVVESLLAWLERTGYLVRMKFQYGKYRMRCLRPLRKIVQGYEEEKRSFLLKLFESVEQKRGWYVVSLLEVSEELGTTREDVLETLQAMERHQDVVLQASQRETLYQRTDRGRQSSVKEVSRQILNYYEQREQDEVNKVDQMVSLVHGEQCMEQVLANHFGEEIPPCQSCSACLHPVHYRTLFGTIQRDLDEIDLEFIAHLIAEKHNALRQSRQLARFLCGITSPATSRARLTQEHEAFSIYSEQSYLDVLLCCETLQGD